MATLDERHQYGKYAQRHEYRKSVLITGMVREYRA